LADEAAETLVKTIGLIGGMSWEASAVYYKLLNLLVQERLGGLHSARVAMISLDFAEPAEYARLSQWTDLAVLLTDAAKNLEAAGADVLLIGANTAHRVADEVAAAVSIPLLHICDCAAHAVNADGVRRVALLGTRYTMEEDFFKSRLAANGLDVVIPTADERALIHRTILDELVLGQVLDTSRQACRKIIARLVREEGAEGVILGCTELPLLLTAEDASVPLYDTTRLHASTAVEAVYG
jgi:aspartate racemase